LLSADLTAIAGAPVAAGDPHGYTTDLPCQGPVARVDYRATGGHIEELPVQGGQRWMGADLTAIAGAPAAASKPGWIRNEPHRAGPRRAG